MRSRGEAFVRGHNRDQKGPPQTDLLCCVSPNTQHKRPLPMHACVRKCFQSFLLGPLIDHVPCSITSLIDHVPHRSRPSSILIDHVP